MKLYYIQYSNDMLLYTCKEDKKKKAELINCITENGEKNMIKKKRGFISENGIKVIMSLEKISKSRYEIYLTIIGSTHDMSHKEYLTEIGKVGSKWFVTEMNLDNFERDYQDIKFNKLSELIEYIGITQIENRQYFNL